MQYNGGTELPNGTQPPAYSTPPTYEEANVPAGSNQPPASANKWDIPNPSAPPATSEPPANTALPVHNNNAVQTTPQVRGTTGKKQIMIGPFRIGVLILLVTLLWVLLMEFCALCVSNKLTTVKLEVLGQTYTAHCGWDKIKVEGVSEVKWSESDDEDSKKNKSAGASFIAMGILSFFLILAMIPLVLNMEFGFLPKGIPIWYVNLGACFVLWIFMTCAWGAWANQNTCQDFDDSRHGDGLNLMITAWFFFTFFYIPASIPHVQKALFGPNACTPREQ